MPAAGRGPAWTRRRLLAAAGLGVLAGCGGRLTGSPGSTGEAARLTARPQPGVPATPPAPGTQPLDLGVERPPLLHVPPAADGGLPLVVALHGAGGDAEAGVGILGGLADERGLLVLAPSSRGSTWDAVTGGHGEDAALLDRALARVFSTVPVDPARVAVAGFSDGASYALGLGLANGDLFGEVVAFSPGSVAGSSREGRPAVFVSHGDADDVLPVERTSRRIVPVLREDGYDVTYRRFAGGHTVPPGVAREAVDRIVR
ncbi:alpha/beta hydrolase [Geodermatophilus sp. DSM 45219]|uniref:alpha/beta hydrolase n=1 Tax=Geodermatophilus sp. DSM 45219 TaxID=1881103 RepID=UPI000882CFEB|nr:PHB depolymerase family esterase [Geodermatophilus sp. DSM 45219]SDN77447.1 Predicted esterase [Geodermatophilus sp. DSM 45219]